MTIAIEHLSLQQLKVFLREQALDTFPALQDESRLTMLAEKWHEYAEFCICRDDSGQLVGMIAFYANQPETGIAYIPHVYVNGNLRGKGLFLQMLERITDDIKLKGYSSIKLEVNKNNMRAQKAYLKNGFRFLSKDMGGVIRSLWKRQYRFKHNIKLHAE